MGFYSYIKYKKCFEWALTDDIIEFAQCITFLDRWESDFMTTEAELFCVKSE